MAQIFLNNCYATLAQAITATDTQIELSGMNGFPASLGAGDYFLLTLYSDDSRYGSNIEVVKVTSVGATSVTVERGFEGTAAGHALGERAEARLTAATLDRIDQPNDWLSITNKPTEFPPVAHGHTWTEVTGKPAEATRWPTWNEVTSKPNEYPPADHGHSQYQNTLYSGSNIKTINGSSVLGSGNLEISGGDYALTSTIELNGSTSSETYFSTGKSYIIRGTSIMASSGYSPGLFKFNNTNSSKSIVIKNGSSSYQTQDTPDVIFTPGDDMPFTNSSGLHNLGATFEIKIRRLPDDRTYAIGYCFYTYSMFHYICNIVFGASGNPCHSFTVQTVAGNLPLYGTLEVFEST